MKKLILLSLITALFVLNSCSNDDDAPTGNYHVKIQLQCQIGPVIDFCVTKESFDEINKNLTTEPCQLITITTAGNTTKKGYYISSSHSDAPCINY